MQQKLWFYNATFVSSSASFHYLTLPPIKMTSPVPIMTSFDTSSVSKMWFDIERPPSLTFVANQVILFTKQA